MSLPTDDEATVADRAVGLRIDINSPVDETGSLLDDARILAHLETIEGLLDRDARLIILAHQGRPGAEDFASLAEHATYLDGLIDQAVSFVDSTFSRDALRAVDRTDSGAALLLENTRFYSEEVLEFDPQRAASTFLVERLSPALDLFVNDAFACAHRSQPSIVGFPQRLPSYAGQVMARELDVLGDLASTPEPRTAVLAGAKLSDSLEFMETLLSDGRVDEVLVGGLLANLFFVANGLDPGDATEADLAERGYADEVPRARRIYGRFADAIVLPTDVAIEDDGRRQSVSTASFPVAMPPRDIGEDTAADWADRLDGVGTVICNGPLGKVDIDLFTAGSKRIFEAVDGAELSIAGGGDTAATLRALEVDAFDHVSTGGGAAIALLSGCELPGVTALEACTVAPPS